MTDYYIIPSMLVFSLFLILGVLAHFKQKNSKWIYFCLSILFLVCSIGLVLLPHWDMNEPKNSITDKPPKSEQGEKTDAEKDTPPANQTPHDDESVEKPTPSTPQYPNETPIKINVPANGAITYSVEKGDTLWSISNRSTIPIEKIKNWNNLNSDVIYVGQVLKLYGKNAEPPKQNEQSASSVIIEHGSLKKKEIALTFDAGSDAAGIRILDVLKKYNLKATFFLTGKWVEMFPDYAKRIATEGHEIGNHTYSHPDAVKTSEDAFKKDILKSENIIKTVTGISPRPYFRFPYGSYNNAVLKTVGEAGYAYSIQWSLDTIDWQQPSTEVIVSRIEKGASNGDIILMHIGGIHTPEAVDKVIPILQSKGYTLVTLSTLLKE